MLEYLLKIFRSKSYRASKVYYFPTAINDQLRFSPPPTLFPTLILLCLKTGYQEIRASCTSFFACKKLNNKDSLIYLESLKDLKCLGTEKQVLVMFKDHYFSVGQKISALFYEFGNLFYDRTLILKYYE